MKRGQYIDKHGVKTAPIQINEEDIKITETINLSRQVAIQEKEIKNNMKFARISNLIAFGALLVSIASLIVSVFK